MTIGVEGQALQACREILKWWSEHDGSCECSPYWDRDLDKPQCIELARQALIAAGEIEG